MIVQIDISLLTKLIGYVVLCLRQMVLIFIILLQIFICITFTTRTFFSVYPSCMHVICNKFIQVPFIPLIINNAVLKHYTRDDHNVQINNLSLLDRQHFVYRCILFWNNLPIEYRTLPKRHFIRACKVFLHLA